MLNMTNHQRDANQNYSEMSPHTCQNGKNVKKREPLYTVGENVNWCSLYGKQYVGSSENNKTKQIYDPIMPRLVYRQRKWNTNLKTYMHSSVHSSIIYNSQDMKTT